MDCRHEKRLSVRVIVVYVSDDGECFVCGCELFNRASTLAQRKRVGLITQRSLDRDQQVLAMFTDPRIACFATSALRLPRIEYKQSKGQKDALCESRRSHIAKR